jgi:hypothetical protein
MVTEAILLKDWNYNITRVRTPNQVDLMDVTFVKELVQMLQKETFILNT